VTKNERNMCFYFSDHFECLVKQSLSFLKLLEQAKQQKYVNWLIQLEQILCIRYVIIGAAKDTKSDQASFDVAGVDCFVEFERVLKPKGCFLMVTTTKKIFLKVTDNIFLCEKAYLCKINGSFTKRF
jgi:hypothetical protein